MGSMDWFETLFRLSPDGGDGSFEVVFGAVIALATAAFARRLWARRRARAVPRRAVGR